MNQTVRQVKTKRLAFPMAHKEAEAFEAGYAAFGEKAPLDNPFFGDTHKVALFNAWSDGWITGQDECGVPDARYFFYRKNNDCGLIGITASWGRRE